MSGGSFDADWLALREPADTAARSIVLARRLRAMTPPDGNWRIIDLGAGTGANRRWLKPRLGGRQHWTLADNDPRLLRHAVGPGLRRIELDLSEGLDPLNFRRADLITASALLDLVSEAWLQRLIARCRESGAALLFALSYDGHIAWNPADGDDDLVRHLVNRHQRGDKGFGASLGPAAGTVAAKLLRDGGYRVRVAPSSWRLGAGQSLLQMALLDGWLTAAMETAPDQAKALKAWAVRRRQHIATGESHLVVGHVDVLAVPKRRRFRS